MIYFLKTKISIPLKEPRDYTIFDISVTASRIASAAGVYFASYLATRARIFIK
jgi:hypothetical protein